MVAELSVSHAYITGGDWETPARPQVALPGAVFEPDAASNRFRLARIYRGHNEEPSYRAPLSEIGVDAREGDYLLAIDGEPLLATDNPYQILRYRADRPVRFTLNDQPSVEGAREVVYQPITSERALRYLEEVEANRRKVDEWTDGRVGYLHIPDMGAEGIREFIKWFYGQIRREGLVIDVRGNGGGNVSQMLIERLSRSLLGTRFARTFDTPGTYPSTVFHGHLVCILDEDSASDGDIFPYRFREAGLGPLIGKRSWGGVIGITNHGQLIDGGTVNVPQYGTNALDGSWVIEGIGVEPRHGSRERSEIRDRWSRPATRASCGGSDEYDRGRSAHVAKAACRACKGPVETRGSHPTCPDLSLRSSHTVWRCTVTFVSMTTTGSGSETIRR